MNEQEKAALITKKMFENDNFSHWLGIVVKQTGAGSCVLQMEIREEMLNGFGILHGGVTFSFADSALAFACNSHGAMSVVLDASMSYPRKCLQGDVLTATAKEMSLTNKTGIYQILVTNQNSETVGIFKGVVYRTQKQW